jgi:hypothetical protein
MKLRLLVCAMLLLGLQVSPGHAQATRTWVSGLGDDVNPCSRTAACKTFAGAISKTAAGGVINCLDSGGFGAVTITKAITISCDSVEGSVLAAGSNAIVVSAGANDVVTLRGFQIEGSAAATIGIKFTSGAALHVENCVIHGFSGAPGVGLSFAPGGASALSVVDTVIRDNTGAGISIQPTGSGSLSSGIIENVKLLNNGTGLLMDGTVTTVAQFGAILRNSIVAANKSIGVSIVATAGKAQTFVIIDRVAITGSATGIQSTGTGADVDLGSSVVTNNGTGLSFTAPAEIRSYQTNELRSNITTNGTSSSTLQVE